MRLNQPREGSDDMADFRRRLKDVRRLLLPWMFWLMLASLLTDLVVDAVSIVRQF
jgi:hypothetical protein